MGWHAYKVKSMPAPVRRSDGVDTRAKTVKLCLGLMQRESGPKSIVAKERVSASERSSNKMMVVVMVIGPIESS